MEGCSDLWLFRDVHKNFLQFRTKQFCLKVPKREIFDRSDFRDFYTIKSLRAGDFGVKIENLFKNI